MYMYVISNVPVCDTKGSLSPRTQPDGYNRTRGDCGVSVADGPPCDSVRPHLGRDLSASECPAGVSPQPGVPLHPHPVGTFSITTSHGCHLTLLLRPPYAANG